MDDTHAVTERIQIPINSLYMFLLYGFELWYDERS